MTDRAARADDVSRMADPRGTLELRAGTGAPVRLLFVEDSGLTYVIASQRSAEWFAAAAREGSCSASWPDGRRGVGVASVVADPSILARLRFLFVARYGEGTWAKYFEDRADVLEIDPSRHPPLPTAIDRVRGEFDAVARGYSDTVARHPIDRYLKGRVVSLALDELQGMDPVLEIGPGTGYHTLPLLRAGHHVVAIDVSQRMIDELRRAAERAGLSHRLETRTGSLGAISDALEDVPDGHFAAAFSAFGAFNLEPDLGAATRALGRVIPPGGHLAFTSLNRPGIVPLVWELALARPAAGFYRLRGTVPPGGIRYPLELYPRSPSDWGRALSPEFDLTASRAVSVLAPPFDSERLVRFLGPKGVERARQWDSRLSVCRNAPLASEWVFLSFVRTADGKPSEPRARGTPVTGE